MNRTSSSSSMGLMFILIGIALAMMVSAILGVIMILAGVWTFARGQYGRKPT